MDEAQGEPVSYPPVATGLDQEWSRENVPLRDSLAGPTEADNWRHVVARVTLLNLLVADPRVQTLFMQWVEKDDLSRRAEAMAAALDATARAVGLEHRGELWDETAPPLEESIPIELEIDDALTVDHVFRFCANPAFEIEALWNCIDESVPVFVPATVRLMSDEMGLPWPWLVLELVEFFLRDLLGFIRGQECQLTFGLEHRDPPAPSLQFHFETGPHETLTDALKRLVEGVVDVIAQFAQAAAASSLPAGRAPSDETTERQVQWFYRHRVCQESINSIHVKDLYDRATVRHGVREAERLLSLVPIRYE